MSLPILASRTLARKDFPSTMVFGVATASTQVEGAVKEGGRSDSIWDVFARVPGVMLDGSNPDITVDQYHRYQEDVNLMADLGFEGYRFSISWPRIVPDGKTVNDKGIAYYNDLINALIKRGLEPVVTLYHWDLPQVLQESFGGWTSEKIVPHFALYAETCFERFGDRVKHWITFNEPINTAIKGYGMGTHAPGKSDKADTEPYLAAHYLILSHAAAASVYNKRFKAEQGGAIGIAPNCEWAEPASNKIEDINAAERYLKFQIGWFFDPLYFGDYPKVMRDRFGDRLPTFTEEDKKLLKNSIDFVGINQYTSRYIVHAETSTDSSFYNREAQIERVLINSQGENIGKPSSSEWLYVVPWGMRKCLNYLKKTYNNPSVFITENGIGEDNLKIPLSESLDDGERLNYYQDYLLAVAEAINEDGVDVKGYFTWSFCDNWEWAKGFTKRFGLVFIDYENDLARHPKLSAEWFSTFLKGDGGKKA